MFDPFTVTIVKRDETYTRYTRSNATGESQVTNFMFDKWLEHNPHIKLEQ